MVSVPLTIPLLLAILALPLTVALLLLALFTGCKIRFHKSNGEECGINKNIENFSHTVNNFTSKVAQEIKKA